MRDLPLGAPAGKTYLTSWWRRHLQRLRPWIPWLSLTWGLVSGALLARGKAHRSTFMLFFALFLFFSVLLPLWLRWSRTFQEAATGASVSPTRSGLARTFQRHADKVEWVTLALWQSQSQYVLMFCLPLLVWTRSWAALAVTLAVLPTVLWDPWWNRLVWHRSYRLLMRFVAALLAAAFLLPILGGRVIGYFDVLVPIAGVLAVLPWPRSKSAALALPQRRDLADRVLAPALAIAIWALAAVLGIPPIRPLSVWLDRPSMLQGEPQLVENAQQPPELGKRISSAALLNLVSQGLPLCCVTPIVAPPEVEERVVHEWRVNGGVIDRIRLPAIHGSASKRAFRTFSCKRNFGDVALTREIGCRVLLGGKVYLGGLSIAVEADGP